MADIYLEPAFRPQSLGHLSQDLGRHLLDPITASADEVYVCPLARRVIGRRAVPEVGVVDQAELLEQLEGPVDGRNVDAAGHLANLGDDVLGGGVPELRDSLQDELALGGEPVSPGAQLRLPFRSGGHDPSVGTDCTGTASEIRTPWDEWCCRARLPALPSSYTGEEVVQRMDGSSTRTREVTVR